MGTATLDTYNAGAGAATVTYRLIDSGVLVGQAISPLTAGITYGDVLAIAGIMRGGQGDPFIECVFFSDYLSDTIRPVWNGAWYQVGAGSSLFLRVVALTACTVRWITTVAQNAE